MGLHTEYKLKQANTNKVIEVIPLDRGRNRVFGLNKHFDLDEYTITNERLEEIKQEYNLVRADQTNIFDFL
ncbi:hypothetical protein BUZ11_12405 [Staphylococcus gallinarum]|uniref:hypothetical protein n=1 Tax=Staphylococcus gallinarum TaxID=1293 RepID=UPI000D1C9339|nr:hypothetical protein [Staphylococcus gallinarum]MCD8872315.1 hypothetical protein [Staphylococcus gallinarum]MCD8910230.1 hypothetical protein [Staphylococcus gallinarum]MCW0984550.1 hypothetical protein [Staphylococcus gallinarum]PTE76291.1 hypothetical protein BUY96_08495 [Staphylococcus gallinarum]PTL09374.1 hypothetical protein BUZ15_10570 [Staphylococcus gallinarum]